VKLWDVASGHELKSIAAHSSKVNAVAFSPNGSLLASAGSDNTIKLWEVSSGREVSTLRGHTGWVLALAFNPDGQTLASGSADSTVRLWDVNRGNSREFRAQAAVRAIDFSPDGQTLAAGGADSTLLVWRLGADKKDKKLAARVSGPAAIVAVSFVSDGRSMIVAYANRVVRQLDPSSGREAKTAGDSSGTGTYGAIAFSRDGHWQASTDGGRTIELSLLTERPERRVLEFNSNSVHATAFSADGRWFATGHQDRTIRLWDLIEGRQVTTLYTDGSINTIAFSPDSKWLAAGSLSGKIRLWEVAGGGGGPTLEHARESGVNALSFTAEGKKLVSAGVDGKINIWETITGRQLTTLRNAEEVCALSLSADGRSLAAAGKDRILTVWDAATGSVRFKSKGHAEVIFATAFSADNRWLASGSADKTVKLWNPANGQEITTFSGHTGWVNALAFSPDGRWLVSGSDDKSARVWNPSTGEAAQVLTGHSGSVKSLSFSADGRWLATGSDDGSTRMWDTRTWELAATLVSLRENTEWLVVTPNGLFDGSPAAWSQILWRFSGNTSQVAPVEVFFNEFFYPDLLADTLKGMRLRSVNDISKRDRRQPVVTIVSPGTSASSRNVAVRVSVTEAAPDKEHPGGSGVRDVRLFRNGSLVKLWPGDVLKGGNQATLEYSIPILAGENRLTAYAFNQDNVKSPDATLLVTGDQSLKRAGTVYILAVGINQYANEGYNLKWAQQDAREFSAELGRQQERLQRFAHIEVVTLLDQDATRANILMALRRLERGAEASLPQGAPPVLAKLLPAQPEDDVILFFAGHGTAQHSRFYLIPHDLGYSGKRDQLDVESLDEMLRHSISDHELEAELGDIDAGRVLLVIDACNSGQALEADEKRRGPMNSKGLAQLAYEKGMNILAASQSYQAAIETSRLRHGYLTYALIIDGLQNMLADDKPHDGQVLLREWLDYATEKVPQLQASKEEAGRSIRLSGETMKEVQRPRVFYRREAETEPWVIGRADPSRHN
jgi:WD40 repeat protein